MTESDSQTPRIGSCGGILGDGAKMIFTESWLVQPVADCLASRFTNCGDESMPLTVMYWDESVTVLPLIRHV